MRRQFIAELDGQTVREGWRTVREPKTYTHAVVGVTARNGIPYALGFFENEFAAHAAATDWRKGPINWWRKIVVVEAKGYPVKEDA